MKTNKTTMRPEDRDGQPRMTRMARMKRNSSIPRSHFFASIFLPFDSVHSRSYGQDTRQKDGGKKISAANTLKIHDFLSAALPACALCVLLRQFGFGVRVQLFAAVPLLLSVFTALAEVHYVDVNSTNATPPYTNWTTAATNIQDAVDAAVAGDEVVVTNGVCATGGDGGNRVRVEKPVTLRSVNGPAVTTIDGGGSVRCLYLCDGALASGFTLTNGVTYGGGGGAYGGMLINCTLSANVVYAPGANPGGGGGDAYGGGAYRCTLNNCILRDNAAYAYGLQQPLPPSYAFGGGAAYCTLSHCMLTSNSVAHGDGGGAYSCTLNNCSLTGNLAQTPSGPVSEDGEGGGAAYCTLNNCALTGNSAVIGGGVRGGTLNNCTLTGNSGGGAYGCALNNCITYFNTASQGANYDSSSILNYCCTTPQPTNGFGNITNAPLFADTNGWANLRLQPGSLCINAGNNSYATNATDLDGRPRIAGGTVDIGAYEFQPDASGASVNPTISPDVSYVAGATRKISQLIGDTDFETLKPTQTRTESRVGLTGTDRGVSFVHKGVTYVVFGGDSMATTTNIDLEAGLDLTFLADGSVWRPITIPGISQGGIAAPVDGVSVGNRMYLYHSDAVAMGRTVVAVSDDDGRNFTLLYTVPTDHFINVSVSKVNLADWPGFPEAAGEGLVLFGSGSYRASNVRLAFQPAAGIDSPNTLRYFAGLDGAGSPTWSVNEADSIDLFDQPCVGELSVGWNKFIRRWVMLYNCGNPRGINFRTARQPWGPWSTPQVLFDPWSDFGYAHFMHANWSFRVFDNVQNPGREYEWGGEYGPYMFRELATGSDNHTTIYFTMSSWNPFVCVLMKSELTVSNTPVITMPPTDQQVMEGQDALFQVTASAVGALSYHWLRNGAPFVGSISDGFLLTASADDDGAEFRSIVSNASGSVTSNPARLTITANNQGPLVSILSPAVDAFYSGGETISFHGTATDPEDGLLPASAFSWRVVFHHGNHTVPFLGPVCGVTNGVFTVPVRGEQATNVFFRVWLTVTDSAGRKTTVSRDILPRCVTLTLAAEPSGAPVNIDGRTVQTPRATNSVVGMRRTLSAIAPANLAGRSYDWLGWTDGGTVSRSITVPASNATYLAIFRTPTTLIGTNSVWKYLVTPTAPAPSWRDVGFDDTGWPSGRAQLGFGDGDEATTIGSGPDPNHRYITTYFRQSFTLADPNVFGGGLVRLLRDDGGVVYLNGTEVFRSNMGGGLPDWPIEAPTTALPADETTTYYPTNISTGLLRPGTNVLAVEIHQNGAASSDLSFALELRATERDPRLAIAQVGNNVQLSWPYPSTGYRLQSTTNLDSPSVWSTNSPAPVIIGGQNTVTNPITGAQQFYRLSQ